MLELKGVIDTEIVLRGQVDLEEMAPAPGMTWNAETRTWEEATETWNEL